jgi:hypothetical protein
MSNVCGKLGVIKQITAWELSPIFSSRNNSASHKIPQVFLDQEFAPHKNPPRHPTMGQMNPAHNPFIQWKIRGYIKQQYTTLPMTFKGQKLKQTGNITM